MSLMFLGFDTNISTCIFLFQNESDRGSCRNQIIIMSADYDATIPWSFQFEVPQLAEVFDHLIMLPTYHTATDNIIEWYEDLALLARTKPWTNLMMSPPSRRSQCSLLVNSFPLCIINNSTVRLWHSPWSIVKNVYGYWKLIFSSIFIMNVV